MGFSSCGVVAKSEAAYGPAIALSGCSKLTGADQITYTMKNANGDIVAMPSGQQVITDDTKSITHPIFRTF